MTSELKTAAPEALRSSYPHVWVVDDSPAEAELIARAAAGRFATQRFGDGDAVLDALSVEPAPDVLVLDWLLPGTSGVDVCRVLRDNPALATLPVLMLTARTTQDDLVEALEAGADDYIAKPFDPRELQARLTALHRRGRLPRDAPGARIALRGLLGCIPYAALALDRERRVVLLNADAARLIGGESSALGRLAVELLPGLAALEAAATDEGLADVEFNGRIYAPSLRTLPPGAAASAALVLQDVTAYRRVAAALRQSERRLRDQLDATGVGIMFWNAAGQITEANAAFLAMLGRSREDLALGRLRWTDLTPPAYRERDAQALAQARATGSWPVTEKAFVHADGRVVPVILGGATLDGSDARGVAFVFDVTEERRSTAALEQGLAGEAQRRREAEDALRVRDELLDVISHELRGPANAVLGWTQMLQRGVVTLTQQPRALEAIERNAQLQARLIEDLLDASRMINGKLRIGLAPTPVRPIVEAAVESIRPAAEGKSLALSLRLDAGAVDIQADSVRLQQVLTNLLVNAVKFTPSGGRVDVALHYLPACVEVSVADTGRGIEPVFLSQVFERFRQAETDAGRATGGLGLGLAIAEHLVQLHGGSITALSDGPGLGATFLVRLPR